MRSTALIVTLAVLAGFSSAAAMNSQDVLALLEAGCKDGAIIEAIQSTGSTPLFSARDIMFADDEYGIDEELMYLCLLAEPMSKDQVYALAKIDYDEDYFIKLLTTPGITFEPDYAEVAPLDLDDDVRAALMMAKPRGGNTETTEVAPKRAQLTINISGESYQTSEPLVYFYILVDGEVVREVVDDKVDVYIGSASYNKFIYTSYTESIETGAHTIAVAVVPSDRGKPSQGTINSNIMFSKRITLDDSYNQLNLMSRLIPGTQSYEIYEQ
jgi:hypothetical protein